MKIRRIGTLSSVVAVAAVAIVWTVGGAARAQQPGAAGQGPPPPRVSVTTTQLKPEMAATWRDVIRTDGIPAFKKAGIPWRWVFVNGPLGGQGFTYVTVTPIANYAQYDQPNPIQRALGTEGAAKYQAKLQPAIVSTHTIVQTLIPSASLQSFSSTPAPLVRVTTMQLLPGKGQEFATITASEYVPAFKKIDVTDYLVFATSFGGSTLQRTIVTPMSKYAELDAGGPGPLGRALGQEAAQKINQRRGALVSDTQVAILRYVPELSYGVPAPPKTSSQ